MDAIVTISLMTGKNVTGSIEKAIKLPAEVETALANNPEKAAEWIFAEAFAQTCKNGAELIPATEPARQTRKRGE